MSALDAQLQAMLQVVPAALRRDHASGSSGTPILDRR